MSQNAPKSFPRAIDLRDGKYLTAKVPLDLFETLHAQAVAKNLTLSQHTRAILTKAVAAKK